MLSFVSSIKLQDTFILSKINTEMYHYNTFTTLSFICPILKSFKIFVFSIYIENVITVLSFQMEGEQLVPPSLSVLYLTCF